METLIQSYMKARTKFIRRCAPFMACVALAAAFAINSEAANDTNLTIVQYPLPTPGSLPNSITAGSDGNLWFTETNAIGRITTNGDLTEFPVSGPDNITAGPDGNLWFTQPSAIGQITPDGQITEFPLPNIGFSPLGITANLDGNLWFSFGTNIGRITLSGSITLFPLPTFATINGDPRPIFITAQRIAAGVDGTLWFTDHVLFAPWAGTTRQNPELGTMTTNGVANPFVVSGSPLSGVSDRVIDVTLAPDGNLWLSQFTSINSDYSLFYMSPTGVWHPGNPGFGGGYPVFPEPRIGVANRLAAGPDGNVWFTQPGQVVGRITTSGVATIFNTTNVSAYALGSGPDGNLWFTDSANNQVGKIVPPAPPVVPPTFVVPPDVVVSTDAGQCSASNVSLGTPIYTNTTTCSAVAITNDAPGVFNKGTTVVSWGLTDTCGQTQLRQQNVTVFDSEAPVIVCPGDIIVPPVTNALVPVTFTVSATDNCDPAPVVTSSIASGSGFPLGVTTVTCTAQDSSGNQSTCSFTVTRSSLLFDGFAAPIGGADATGGSFDSPVQTFKLNSVIPLRFSISADGSVVTTGVQTLQAIKWTDQTNSEPPIDATPPGSADSGNAFSLVGQQWSYNLSTKDTGMSVGQWQLVATLSDGSQHSVWVQIK